MCVDTRRSGFFGRAEFLGVLGVATAMPAQLSQANRPGLKVPAGLSAGNARAAHIAAASPFIAETYGATVALASSISQKTLREGVLALLEDPKPTYAAKYPSSESRAALRERLVREGLLAPSAPLTALFPPGTEIDSRHAPQPFWSAAGSDAMSHHSYPGGLAVHETFNARIAAAFANVYDRTYFGGQATVDRDTVVAAALYHDVMKSIVFQWNADGTIFEETAIGGTGGHHALSGAEAIARGCSPAFVITLLSAHAAPSLGDEAKVVTWCRAAALIAAVDPLEYGLLRKVGSQFVLAPAFVPFEAFVSYLSDHDYVLSIQALRAVLPQLQRVAPPYLGAGAYPTFSWCKNAALSHLSAIGLYQTLASGGESAFDRAVSDFARVPSARLG